MYGTINSDEAREHDKAFHAAQLSILKRVIDASSPAATREYAEAYALISGKVQVPSAHIQG